MSDKGLTHEELEDKTKPSSSKTGLKTVPSQSKTRGFVVSNLNSAAKINGGSGKPITRPNSGKSTTKGHTKTSTTECTEADKRGGSGKKSYSGKSSDFGSAENDLASKKVQQKRPRQASSSDEQIPHKQKSSAPNAYRTKKKWRKLQEGSLEMRGTTRRWHQVKQVPESSPGMELSVMSYNILAQDLLEMHPHLYSECRRRDMVWCNRGAAIMREIISHNSDIICLQEVQADHWKQDIRPLLNSHGYYGLYMKRRGDKPDGCAILYKKSKFTHIKFVPVQFFQGGILDRDNIGIILLLKPISDIYKGTAKTICVATTHLLFNPRRGDIKLAQLMMFLAEIDKIAALSKHEVHGATRKNPADCRLDHRGRNSPHLDDTRKEDLSSFDTPEEPQPSMAELKITSGASTKKSSQPVTRYCPIILCGDFNSEPFCDLYRFVTSGHLKYEGLVSRFISGQSEGRERGHDVYVGSDLLPINLGITESCQYMNVLSDRLGCKQEPKSKYSRWDEQRGGGEHQPQNKFSCVDNGISDRNEEVGFELQARCKEKSEINDSQIFADTNQNLFSRTKKKDGEISHLPKMNSGQAYHSMNFKSVYPHVIKAPYRKRKDMWEVSSQHDMCSCTVDYIFYSSCPANSQRGAQKEEEQLELLARYSLLTTEEVARTGNLPNATLPSDHLCLVAKFFLW